MRRRQAGRDCRFRLHDLGIGPMMGVHKESAAMGIGSFTSITVFGGATLDRIAMSSAKPVPGASNPGTMRALPGGVGFNVARVLARLGHTVRLVTRIGADQAGQEVLAAARAAGVFTTTVGISPTRPTATYQAALDDKGDLVIGIADMEITTEMTPASVAAAAREAPTADLWIVDANLPVETIDFLIGEAVATSRPVVALPVSPAKAVRLAPLRDRIGLLFANRKEAAVLLGRDPDEKGLSATFLAEQIGRRPTPDVVITDAGGMLVARSDGKIRSFLPFRANVRSVNGAGDALAAGTIHGLAGGRTLFEAVLHGLAAAAITVESEGTLPDELTASMIATRIGAERIAP